MCLRLVASFSVPYAVWSFVSSIKQIPVLILQDSIYALGSFWMSTGGIAFIFLRMDSLRHILPVHFHDELIDLDESFSKWILLYGAFLMFLGICLPLRKSTSKPNNLVPSSSPPSGGDIWTFIMLFFGLCHFGFVGAIMTDSKLFESYLPSFLIPHIKHSHASFLFLSDTTKSLTFILSTQLILTQFIFIYDVIWSSPQVQRLRLTIFYVLPLILKQWLSYSVTYSYIWKTPLDYSAIDFQQDFLVHFVLCAIVITIWPIHWADKTVPAAKALLRAKKQQ